MKKTEKILPYFRAFFISVVLHATIIFLLISLTGGEPARPAGEMAYIVSIDMIKGGDFPLPRGLSAGSLAEERVRERVTTESTYAGGNQSGRGEGSGTGTGVGGGGNSASTSGTGGGSVVLAKIRAKIEATKSYPASARKMGIEGRPTVVFEISESGAIKSVKIAESSGKPIIDEAAVETVKKASPLPYYPGPITLAIRYDLD